MSVCNAVSAEGLSFADWPGIAQRNCAFSGRLAGHLQDELHLGFGRLAGHPLNEQSTRGYCRLCGQRYCQEQIR
jgi:hypothetical protein